MAVYLESYLSFSISIEVTDDIYHAGRFNYKLSIDSADGEKVMSMNSSERFASTVDAKAFGLDWAKAWIDNNRVAVRI